MSFSEVADALNKAIVEIQDKKKIFDSASEAVAKASNAYQKSVDDAQFLRSELEKSLNDSMGDKSNAGRVRISG
jgi:hypothetical protein